MINRLTIVGVGLIGGSLAKALRQANAVKEIVGSGLDAGQLQTAVELGVIDRFEIRMSEAVRGADIIVLAVPVGAMKSVLSEIKDSISPQALLTDVGSTKQSVVDAAIAVFGEMPSRFVPGHPIAGTEKSGVTASFAGLFHNRRVLLTPVENTDPAAIKAVTEMWEVTGAQVSQVSTKHHDQVLAATSHLPHMLAFSLVDTLAKMNDKEEIFQFAAGGFRDFTRIASSDPSMWHDICLTNREELMVVLSKFQQGLDVLKDAIETNNGQALLDIFTRAKQARDKLVEQPFSSKK